MIFKYEYLNSKYLRNRTCYSITSTINTALSAWKMPTDLFRYRRWRRQCRVCSCWIQSASVDIR